MALPTNESELRGWLQGELHRSRVSILVRQLQESAPAHGLGSPNGIVTAGPGGMYVNDSDGKLWVHEAAVRSNAGWVVK